MWPKDHNIKHLRAMEEAFSPDTRDPVRTLKAAGIDITEELEELRNTIAEISGKKPKATTKGRKKKPAATKKAVKKELIKSGVPENVKLEARKLLGVLNGLRYAGYSERVVEKAVKDLLAEGKELAERNDLETLGIYLWTAHLLREGRFGEAEKFLKRNS